MRIRFLSRQIHVNAKNLDWKYLGRNNQGIRNEKTFAHLKRQTPVLVGSECVSVLN
jgi:hypothetical protein